MPSLVAGLGAIFLVVQRLLIVVASHHGADALGRAGICGAQASEVALAGRLITTGPPGKSPSLKTRP